MDLSGEGCRLSEELCNEGNSYLTTINKKLLHTFFHSRFLCVRRYHVHSFELPIHILENGAANQINDTEIPKHKNIKTNPGIFHLEQSDSDAENKAQGVVG